MKTRRIITIAFAVIALSLFTQDVLAFYAPHMGRFLNRDPHGQMHVASARVGISAEPTMGRFVNREAIALETPQTYFVPQGRSMSNYTYGFGALLSQIHEHDMAPYHDGMNLYQYVQSSPLKLVDPSGEFGFVVPLVMGGRGASNGILACQNLVNCQKCLSDAGDLIRMAQRTLRVRSEEKYRAWLKAAQPSKHCNAVCKEAGKRGVRALAWFGGQYLRGITLAK